ncbi:MAG: UPF0149 family protein [Rhodanobacteraceae bacterium]
MAPLSDEELEELDQFLLSDLVSEEALPMSGLDGYLTAIVVGPIAVMPSRWLPGVWGSTEDDSPTYENIEQAQRILTLIMRHMNGIVWSLQHDPDAFDPMFDTLKFPDESREHLDGEMWAHAFIQGIALTRKDWQPLFDDAGMVQVLRPIHLLGSEDVTTEEDALTRTREQREQLAQEIPAAVAEIYRYWQPCRETSAAPVVSTSNVRSNPKVGRNDPCPCGSGRKFKKCCGAPATLH